MRTRYRLSFPTPHAHLVDVEARFTAAADHGDEVELKMAAWTPGSYMVRDYARHVQDLTVADETGRALPAVKIDKSTWRVNRAGAGRDVVARYRVYAWELTVRTSHVDDSHAFVNGAPTWLWVDARRGESIDVEIDAPTDWTVTTGLASVGPGRWRAADLDELLDCPIHAGPGQVIRFEAAGKPHELAVWGRVDAGGVATMEGLARDTATIVEAHAKVFGGLPYDRYAFMLMLAPGAYGGLEHRSSTALLSTPFAFATRKKYEDLLELVSHEYFHLWNVKRIRPRALGPFDYGRENYTRALWIMEGLTSYYDRYTLRRAGLQPVKRYLEKLAEEWGKLLSIPGRLKQSIEESSFDAWVKLYRPDENSVNTTVSYYLKGGIVCLCMDLEIRRRTGGKRSLDDVLRRLFGKYGAAPAGFDEAEVQKDFEAAVDLDLGSFFDRYVRGREDPDLAGALAGAGLQLKTAWEKHPPEGMTAESVPGWMGVNLKSDAGRVFVASTLTGSPAEAAGVYAGDEIVALDGFRVEERSLNERINARRAGDKLRLTLFRREELRELELVLGPRPHDKFDVVPLDGPGEAERILYKAWLGEDHPKKPE